MWYWICKQEWPIWTQKDKNFLKESDKYAKIRDMISKNLDYETLYDNTSFYKKEIIFSTTIIIKLSHGWDEKEDHICICNVSQQRLPLLTSDMKLENIYYIKRKSKVRLKINSNLHSIIWQTLGQYCPLSRFTQSLMLLQITRRERGKNTFSCKCITFSWLDFWKQQHINIQSRIICCLLVIWDTNNCIFMRDCHRHINYIAASL